MTACTEVDSQTTDFFTGMGEDDQYDWRASVPKCRKCSQALKNRDDKSRGLHRYCVTVMDAQSSKAKVQWANQNIRGIIRGSARFVAPYVFVQHTHHKKHLRGGRGSQMESHLLPRVLKAFVSQNKENSITPGLRGVNEEVTIRGRSYSVKVDAIVKEKGQTYLLYHAHPK